MVDIQTEEISSLPEPNVMVVDDDSHVGKSIGRLLTLEGISHEIFENPLKALAVLEKNETIFWLIISDQRMPEMKGTVFLEKAKTISPGTTCFLITAYTDIKTIMDSVNKGAVYRYILKPWDDDVLLAHIKSALKKFQAAVENKMLLETAVDQTKQLYRLGSRMLKTINRQKMTLAVLAREKARLETKTGYLLQSADQRDGMVRAIQNRLAPGGTLDVKTLDTEYRYFVKQLYNEFDDLANRNGFSMPALLEDYGTES